MGVAWCTLGRREGFGIGVWKAIFCVNYLGGVCYFF